MSYTSKLIKILKEKNQDFEWYPTTEEMIEALASQLNHIHSVLDIGAGDGRVLKSLENKLNIDELYSIEKSLPLIQQMDRSILNIGRDFFTTSIVEKTVDLVFCNPPYSEYEKWVCRILKEGNFKYFAFVIPRRWRDNLDISRIIKSRKLNLIFSQNFDFFNAERRARAKVELLIFKKEYKDNSFENFLKEHFQLSCLDFNEKIYSYERLDKERRSLSDETKLIDKEKIIDFLIQKYNEDMQKCIISIKNLSMIDNNIYSYLDLSKETILKGVERMLKDLRALYWGEIFNKLEVITSKVTEEYRREISSSVISNSSIDFTRDNLESVLIWFIKNANIYIEKSYLAFFDKLSIKDNALMYKSNERFLYSQWRYTKEAEGKELGQVPLKLDYRIVVPNIARAYYSYYSYSSFLNDLKVIAHNLGYKFEIPYNFDFRCGESGTMYFENGDVFFEWKAYKNTNVHFKFSQEFMAKFNLAVGRLRKWFSSKKEAKQEFSNVKDEIIDEIFEKSLLLDFKNCQNLLLGS
ncbi:DUF4942 domain-containing protein [Campylobacter lari]|nr:DUF4942 domain-containing protein [Campylobacter lari]EAL0061499.1 DUF4942 domain-containing protein [Campylobacter lari]EII0699931.1 DUF4942 domain-containing protein [Campylobacter lari]EKL1317286.1 DUF4942 domain-containing protein [Campylobacter lari]